MLPPGVYVTLEHEFILIFRKGQKREFRKEHEKKTRRRSSFFWEERNIWFSDIWTDIKGAFQDISDQKIRKRSGAFLFEIPYRLINMFSVKEDTVADPFSGTGTTMFAAMASCRNFVGYELEKEFQNLICSRTDHIISYANERIRKRLQNHNDFIKAKLKEKGEFKYVNYHYPFPVMTHQEKELILNELISIKIDENIMEVTYSNSP